MRFQNEAATPKEAAAKTSTQTGANTHCSVWHGHYGEAALRLARDGWKVLPLRVRGKAAQEGQSEHVFDMLRSRFMQAGLSLGEINQTIVSARRYIIANPNVHTSKQVTSWR